MTTPAEAARYTVEISERHVLEQEVRLERQREVLANLERGDHPDMVVNARRFLAEMEKALAEMKEHAAAAQERWAQATIDGHGLRKLR